MPAQIKRARRGELLGLGEHLRRQALLAQIGGVVPVLVERPAGPEAPNEWLGYSPNYFPVRIAGPGDEDLTNRILPVRLTGLAAEGDRLVGACPV